MLRMKSTRVIATLFALITLAATSVAQTTIFREAFTNNLAGWTLDPEWQIGTPQASTGQMLGHPDPATDVTFDAPPGVAGVVIGGNCALVSHAYRWLTSPVIDTFQCSGMTLTYWRWLNSESLPYMNNRIQVYDGQTWHTVWESGFTQVVDAAWTAQTIDISAYANAHMRLRFGFATDILGAAACSQWNIDEVRISAIGHPLRNPGFESSYFYPAPTSRTLISHGFLELPEWSSINTAQYVPATEVTPSEGSYSVDLNNGGTFVGGGIYEPIYCHADRTYIVGFDMAVDVGAPSTVGVKATFESADALGNLTITVSENFWLTVPNATAQNPGWTRRYFVYTTVGSPVPREFGLLLFEPLTAGPRGALIDNVSWKEIGGDGQANSVEASLSLNSTSQIGIAGPFAHAIASGDVVMMQWNGPANMPFILAASLTDTHRTNVSCLGSLDIGTAPTFSDVFIIADGTSPGFGLFFTLSPFGAAAQALATGAIPPGTEIAFQGVVVQPVGSACAYKLTASQQLIVY